MMAQCTHASSSSCTQHTTDICSMLCLQSQISSLCSCSLLSLHYAYCFPCYCYCYRYYCFCTSGHPSSSSAARRGRAVSDSTARRALGRCDSAASVNSNCSIPGFHFDRSDTSEPPSAAGTTTSTATAAAAAVAAVAALNNSDPSLQQQQQQDVHCDSGSESDNGRAASVGSAGSVSPGGVQGGHKEAQGGAGAWQVVQRQGTRRKQVSTTILE
jgi:hypothetical protein